MVDHLINTTSILVFKGVIKSLFVLICPFLMSTIVDVFDSVSFDTAGKKTLKELN